MARLAMPCMTTILFCKQGFGASPQVRPMCP
jgi:hypothetical protein